jgi:hypothetical protein
MFVYGFLCGAMVGGTLGAFIMAALAVGKDSDFWPPRPSIHDNINSPSIANDHHSSRQDAFHDRG